MSRRPAARAGRGRRAAGGGPRPPAVEAPAPRSPRRVLDPAGDRSPLRGAVLGLGTMALAAGLVVVGVVVLSRGTAPAQQCAPDPLGWNGVGGGGAHTGSLPGVAADHAAGWRPDWRTAPPARGGELVGTPAAAGGSVYAGDAGGRLVALEAGSGAVSWTSEPSPDEAGPVTAAIGLDGCSAVVVTRSGDGGVVRAVDLGTHARRSGTRSDDIVRGGPVILNGVAFTALAARTPRGLESRVDGIDLLDGAHRIRQRFPAAVETAVAVTADHVYVGDFGGSVYGFAIAADGRSLAQLWSAPLGGIVSAAPVVTDTAVLAAGSAGRLVALDPAAGQQRWSADAGGPVETAPVVVGDVVVVADRAGRITAVALADGAVRWRVETGAAVTGLAAVSGGTVYVAGADGSLRALATGDGAERARWVAGAPLVGGPVVAARRVVVTAADGTVAALPL